MNAHTDSIPVVPAQAPVSRREARRAQRAREERDLELLARVGRGDQEATASLAERMAPRVERIARALMGGSLEVAVDTDDAALHALVELLRSHERYRGKEPLERWAERSAALSVMRFARAVSRRSQPDGEQGQRPVRAPVRRFDERSARTFEQYLQTLSDTARQTLLLRHALGFKLSELSDALKCSAAAARQQLLEARNELRSLIRRRNGTPATLGAGATRWCELRDREALGETLRDGELEELAQLEAREPEIWAFVAQVRALELYFEGPHGEPATLNQATWVMRAIAALRVTAIPPAPPRASGTLGTQQLRDLDGSRLVRWLAIGASFALAGSTAYALMVYRPMRGARTPTNLSLAEGSAPLGGWLEPAVAPPRPTVEALPKVTTAQRSARLRRDGRVLAGGTLIAQGDRVEALEHAGCLQIEPDSEVCLAPFASLRVVSIATQRRRLELLRGRAVVRIGPLSESTRTSLQVGELVLSSGRAVFGVERSPDARLVRVRALRGALEAEAGGAVRPLADASSTVFRAPAGFEQTLLSPALAQRDWELLAAGQHVPAATSRAARPSTQPASFELGDVETDVVDAPAGGTPAAAGAAEPAAAVPAAEPAPRAADSHAAESAAAPAPAAQEAF